MTPRPALVDPHGGPMTGNKGGPMPLAKPAATWSHVAGKRHREPPATMSFGAVLSPRSDRLRRDDVNEPAGDLITLVVRPLHVAQVYRSESEMRRRLRVRATGTDLPLRAALLAGDDYGRHLKGCAKDDKNQTEASADLLPARIEYFEHHPVAESWIVEDVEQHYAHSGPR